MENKHNYTHHTMCMCGLCDMQYFKFLKTQEKLKKNQIYNKEPERILNLSRNWLRLLLLCIKQILMPELPALVLTRVNSIFLYLE